MKIVPYDPAVTIGGTHLHANDLDRARALLANDPDEMDEQWLAGIIAAVRAEAKAEGWDDAVKALRDCYKDDRGIIADVYADWLATNRPSPLRRGGLGAMTAVRQPAEPSAEAMDMARVWMQWMQSSERGEPYERRLASMFDQFAAEATAAERERIARRVSEQQILRFQVGRDPLVEVNEFIQDLAYEIATDWEDYE